MSNQLKLSRRNILKLGAGACFLPAIAKAESELNRFDGNEPHFFLHIYIAGGMDASYLFDARPKAFTQAGKIQNFYDSGLDAAVWQGKNGQQTLVSPSGQKLQGLKEYFSVINGVHMSTAFDGHEQNINFLFSGNPFGGEYFLPYLNKNNQPLDYITIGRSDISGLSIKNAELSLAMNQDVAKALVNAADSGALNRNPGAFDRLVDERIAFIENRNPMGLFSSGARLIREGLSASYTVESRLGALDLSDLDSDPNLVNINLALKCFAGNVCNSASYIINDSVLDAHSNSIAVEQPKLYDSVADQIANIINFLRTTPYDEARGLSFYDVTTFLIGSEFSRTMRQLGKTMEETGTDHNTLGNSLLIGGKKIRNGLIVGATDLDRIDQHGEFVEVADVHRKLDNNLIKVMGRPFDFERGEVLAADTFAEYRGENYITMSSVANTIMKQFNVPTNLWRKPSSVVGAENAPSIDTLLT